MGAPIQSTNETQAIDKVRVYPGADSHFTLYSDDGTTYAYEHGKHDITELQWDNTSGKLSHRGAQAWNTPDTQVIEVVKAAQ